MIDIIKRSTNIPDINTWSGRPIELKSRSLGHPNTGSYCLVINQEIVKFATLWLGIFLIVVMVIILDLESLTCNIVLSTDKLRPDSFWSVRVVILKSDSIGFEVLIRDPSPASYTTSVVINVILFWCPVPSAVDNLLFWQVKNLIVLSVQQRLYSGNCRMGITWVAFALVLDWRCEVGQVNINT